MTSTLRAPRTAPPCQAEHSDPEEQPWLCTG